jgi:hypothetical protein
VNSGKIDSMRKCRFDLNINRNKYITKEIIVGIPKSKNRYFFDIEK